MATPGIVAWHPQGRCRAGALHGHGGPGEEAVQKITVLNQKGGVGKTTVSVNLAYGLARVGKRTLLIDLDPQAHSTAIYCPEVPRDVTIGAVFENRKADLGALVLPAEVKGETSENLWIIPSNIHLAVTAERVISQHFREQILDRALKRLAGQYDVVLLDCPPNLGVITANAIYTADTILIPTTYGKYSLDGIADLFASIEVPRGDRQDGRYVLRNAFGSRNRQTDDHVDRELENVEELLPQTALRKTEAINQAQISGEPIFTYDPGGHGAQDFETLTREVLRRG
jgi:chromosome partitioning protein